MDTKGIAQYKDTILALCNALRPTDRVIAIVGSRVRDDYKPSSDMDVTIFAPDVKTVTRAATVDADGFRICIAWNHLTDGKNILKTPHGEYDLSWYNLEEGVLYEGTQDAEFVVNRNKWRDEIMNNRKKTQQE